MRSGVSHAIPRQGCILSKIGESKIPADDRSLAPQLHADPGEQFLERERLDHVVVGAVLENGDSIVDGVPRR